MDDGEKDTLWPMPLKYKEIALDGLWCHGLLICPEVTGGRNTWYADE
jgi:hypothetical protein